MKIYDCFLYFDEDLLLEARLNILDKFIDKFVIVESKYSHSGESRTPRFSLSNLKKYENKIEYILLNDEPDNLYKIKDHDEFKNEKIIINGNLREFYQRNAIIKGLSEAQDDDFILISDVDEIPKLDEVNFNEIKNNFVFFNQIFCCYKLNLCSNMRWCGSRMVRKKNLITPQWLRDIKDKNYPFWRIDTYFSKKKYNNIQFIENGGWHFSYLKDSKGVENKLKSIRHHIEYDLNPLGEEKISNLIKNRKLIYDYKADQRTKNKFENNETLKILDEKKLPEYIRKNKDYYKHWLES